MSKGNIEGNARITTVRLGDLRISPAAQRDRNQSDSWRVRCAVPFEGVVIGTQKTRSRKSCGLNSNGSVCLNATEVTAVGRADFDDFPFFDKERHVHHQPCLELGGFLNIAGGIAFDSVGTLNNFKRDR